LLGRKAFSRLPRRPTSTRTSSYLAMSVR
jgi:hypothetical protein